MASEIPDDIMEKAAALDFMRGGPSSLDIATAIYAERMAIVDTCRKLAEHQKSRGQFADAFTSTFIADQIQAGKHVE